MRIAEFKRRTGLGTKTAQWLFDNIFSTDGRYITSHREFTDGDVEYINARQPENFEYIFKHRIKQINGASRYYVSDDGIVYNFKRGFLEEQKPYINSGYKYVSIVYDNGDHKHTKISRLVALHFVDNPYNKPVPNHKDGDKLNDNYTNLEWSTISENTQHAFDMGLAHNDSGFMDSQSKPVVMYDNNGECIGIYGSIREAARELGYSLGYISNQVRRNVKYGTQGVYFNYLNK
ncbi:MAG: HNH endonuclease [Lachnospiraceae bacterium]|nr:HNH endonuclease [Lachnospiraceae bacterium]